MERRESIKNPNDEARKETSKTPRSPSKAGRSEREKRENEKDGHRTTRPRDRRKSTESRPSNQRASIRGERRENRKKVISRGEEYGKKKNNRKLTRLSETSNAIGKRPSRRLTRASLHSPSKNKKSERVPAIPKRVFKALHLLRHEKFLRVVSRYIKPRVKQ